MWPNFQIKNIRFRAKWVRRPASVRPQRHVDRRRKIVRHYFVGEMSIVMKNKLMLPVIAAGLVLGSVPVFAHHGDAGRYEDNVVVMKGTVVELQLITPHSIVVVDVPDENGKVVRWQAEMGGRAAMIKDFGWTKDTVKPGDKITLTGRKVKSGAPYMNLTDRANIVMTDTGKEIFRTNNYGTEERKRPAAGLGNPAPGNPVPTN
jgi:hypothetical protein